MSRTYRKSFCPNCDKRRATEEDYEKYEEVGGAHLCWAEDTPDCTEEPIDWRARALSAEDTVRAMRHDTRTLITHYTRRGQCVQDRRATESRDRAISPANRNGERDDT